MTLHESADSTRPQGFWSRIAHHPRSPWIVLLLWALVIVTAGLWLYDLRREREIEDARRNLKTVLDLKVEGITLWRAERLGDAEAIAENPFNTSRILSFLEQPAPGDKGEDIVAWLGSFQDALDVSEAVLIDARGKPRLTASSVNPTFDPSFAGDMATVLRTCRPLLSDFHRSAQSGRVHLDLFAPLLRQTPPAAPRACFGAIVLEIDPGAHLFASIQTWPTPSATAETLLVRRDGDDALYLNQLRHSEAPALTLRLPLRDGGLPAAAAALGREGPIAGVDHRGHQVQTVARRVPDSPWALLAKEDEAEILAPLRTEVVFLSAFLASALLLSGLAIVLWRMRREAGLMRTNLELERQRARTQGALQQSETMYETLFNRANDGILVLSEDLRLLDVNQLVCDRLQYTRAELLTMRLPDIVAPERLSMVSANARRASDGANAMFESTHLRRDGTTFEVEINCARFEVDGGRALLGVVRDVTARKQAAAELAAAEKAVRRRAEWAQGLQLAGEELSTCKTVEALAQAAVQSALTCLGARLAWLSAPTQAGDRVTLARSTPWPQQEWDTRTCPIEVRANGAAWTIADISTQRDCRDCLVLAENDGFLSCGAWPIFVAGKNIATLSIRGCELGEDSPLVGASALIQVFCRQVGYLWERLLTDERLRRLTRAIEQSPVSIVITDTQGRIEYVNPHFTQVTGYAAEEVIGQNPRLLKSDGGQTPEFYADLWQTITRGEAWRGELRNRKKNGDIWFESGSISPVRNENGEITHYVAVKEDITRRKEVERELREAKVGAEAANRAKSAFLANMSHEIRTPMNAVLGFSQLMLRDPALTPAQREHLDTINRAGAHLLNLINDILEISKIEAGRAALKEAPFGLDAVLTDMEVMFRLRAEAKGLRLIVERGTELPHYAVGDEVKLRQVLTNLLGNAIKFTVHGGVALRVASDSVTGGGTTAAAGALRLKFEVRDTGVGIASDELDKLFQPFEQTRSGRQAGGGTGLGLAISRHMVRMMGGDLSVASEPELGTVFRFDVALGECSGEFANEMPVERRVTALSMGQAPVRVLVVDDNGDNRELLAQTLAAVGFEVREAADGRQALRLFEEWSPHLCMTDLRMPGMDGYETIRAMRANAAGQAVRIIAVSASAFAEDRQRALAVGADGFMGKPFREAELFEQIRRLLGLTFEYAADPTVQSQTVPARPSREARRSQVIALLTVAPGLLEQALGAIGGGDIALLREHLVAVRSVDPVLAERLQGLADEYEYDELTNLLRAALASAEA